MINKTRGYSAEERSHANRRGGPTGEVSAQAENGRQVGEVSQAREVPHTREGCEKLRAKLPLIIMPAEWPVQVD